MIKKKTKSAQDRERGVKSCSSGCTSGRGGGGGGLLCQWLQQLLHQWASGWEPKSQRPGAQVKTQTQVPVRMNDGLFGAKIREPGLKASNDQIPTSRGLLSQCPPVTRRRAYCSSHVPRASSSMYELVSSTPGPTRIFVS
jgi:hypothetical protein